MTYNLNNETGKIELHFNKAAYMALGEDKKKEIKSAFLWSSYAGAWVSRTKQPNNYRAESIAKGLGMTYSGETGEKLSFSEQVERTQERAEGRAERMEAAAGKAEERSNQAYKRADYIGSFIPMGQPILVGHHSEKRHRRDIDKIDNAMRTSVEESKKAEYYEEKAKTASYTASGKQYESPVYLGNRIRECEADLRRLNRYLSGIDLVNKESGRLSTKETPCNVSDSQREKWTSRVNEETEKLNFYKEKLAACGIEIHTKESLKEKKCTHVNYRGTWYPVKSINGKSVTVLNWMSIPGNAWKWTVHFPDIKGIKTVEDMYRVHDRDGNENKPQIKY